MFARERVGDAAFTNVPAVPEVHVPSPVSLPTVEPLHEKPDAEVEPVPSVTADPGAAAVTVNVVPDVYEAVAPTAA